jgi:membrane-bound serine protease (ClpP class)
MFSYIKKKQLHGNLIMNEALEEDLSERVNLTDLIGKEGAAATMLRPAGEVDFNGIRFEASSEGSYIEKDDRVRVVEVKNNKLIVRREGRHDAN